MILKRMAGVVMAAMLITTFLAGCSSNDTRQSDGSNGTDKGNTKEAATMGRYLEEDVNLPEGITDIQSLCEMEDGSLRLAGTGESYTGGVWETKDQGKKWDKIFDYPEELKGNEMKYLSSVALSPKGGAAAITTDYSKVDMQSGQGSVDTGYWILDETGKAASLPVALGNSQAGNQSTNISSQEPVSEGQEPVSEGQKKDGAENPDAQLSSVEKEVADSDSAEVQSGDENAGQNAQMEMPQYLNSWKYAPDNNLVGMGMDGKIHIIDPASGAVLRSIENSDAYFTNIGFVGNTLAAYASNGVYYYDMTTGSALEKDEVLNEQLGTNSESSGISVGGSDSAVLLQGGKEDNILFYCNKNGIFRHVLGGNVSEQLVDGSLNSMADPSVSFSNLAAMKDGVFFLSFRKDMGSHLVRYTYSEDTPSVPEKEVNIYSLNENAEVRQAIALFQKQNPDTRVNYEVGLTGDDGVTVSDAIRTLNTNIMAGKGPDLFILDGMSIDSYENKGLLADMSEIIKKVSEQDGFLENITKPYEKDGKTYAIPTRFIVPGIQSGKKNLDGIKDLTTLAATLEGLKQENADKDILGFRQPEDLVKRLYDTCSREWINEDGTLKEDALKEFFTQLKKIYDLDKKEAGADDYNSISMNFGGFLHLSGIADNSMSYLAGSTMANLGNINSINDLMQVLAINEKLKDSGYKTLDGQASKVFVPGTMIGISSKAENKESAEKLASFMLSKDAQTVSQGGGFPVNKAALDEIFTEEAGTSVPAMAISTISESGVDLSLELKWPTKEQAAEFKALAEGLTTPANTDSIIREAVYSAADDCLNGTVSIDEAVKAVMQKVNLYLSE